MGVRNVREKTLQQLLEDNFVISRYCRKITEITVDVSLKYYFQNMASRRSQFALEIGEEISFYSGKEPYLPTGAYDRNRKEMEDEHILSLIKKACKLNKESLQKYQDALCRIHDGSCREILLRHKVFIENCIFELKSLKTLLKDNEQQTRETKQVRSQS